MKVELTKEDRLNENNQVIGLNWVGSIPQGASKIRFLYKYSTSPPQLFTTPYIELKQGYDKFFANYSGETSYYDSNISISGGTSSSTTATYYNNFTTEVLLQCRCTLNEYYDITSNIMESQDFRKRIFIKSNYRKNITAFGLRFYHTCSSTLNLTAENFPTGLSISEAPDGTWEVMGTIMTTGTYSYTIPANVESSTLTLSGTIEVKDSLTGNIYLDSNGLTIKCPDSDIGYTQEINGKVYKVLIEYF